ncbi:hypothetical protein JW859_10725 [bacterium]|nr:hypothetical protein [bacterium]
MQNKLGYALVFLGCLVLLAGSRAALADAEAAAEIPAEIAAYVDSETPAWADRAAIAEALVDAGDNWRELALALDAYRTVRRVPLDAEDDAGLVADYNNLVWLVTAASHLDRLELTALVLLESMFQADRAAAEFGYRRDSDFFRRYVLNYRLDDEPVTRWRVELKERYQRLDTETGLYRRATVAEVVAQAAEGFTLHERGYYGNLADPLSIDTARAGSGRELALLTAAALRSQGYATRFVREDRSGESWVEVHDPQVLEPDTAWLPVYPQAPAMTGDVDYALELCGGRLTVVTAGDAFGREQVTPRYGATCAVVPTFAAAGEAQPEFEHWSICAWADGYYKPLDDLGYPLGELDYPADAVDGEADVYYVGAPGEYRLECGVRYPGAVIHVQTVDFAAEPDGRIELAVNLDAPAELPAAALVERQVDWNWGADGPSAPGTYLIVIYDDAEPSVRALELLDKYQDDPRLSYECYGRQPDSEDLINWIGEALKVKPEDELPVVILVIDGATAIYHRGFELSIADWVERALAE